MARFVARGRSFSVGVREAVVEHYATGKEKVLEKGLEAQFVPVGLTDYEIEQGITSLVFRGLPEDRDTGAEVSPRSRLGLFDSRDAQKQNGWTDEEHDLVVETLKTHHLYGQAFVEVVKPPAKAPWNGYDRLTDIDKIVELVLDTQTPVASVIAYELENKNRVDLLEQLELLLEESEPEEIVVSS